VITYHGVLPDRYRSIDPFLDNTLISIPSFRSQLALLKKYFNVISPEHFRRSLQENEELPERSVLLTCDDGLLNNLTAMLPILQEENLQCLFFVTSGSLETDPQMLWYVELYLMLMHAQGDHPSAIWRGVPIPEITADCAQRRVCWLQLTKILSRFDGEARLCFLREAADWWRLEHGWKHRYLDDPLLQQRFQLLGAPELKRLAGMSIGAHSMSHPVLSEQPADLAQAEITVCREAIERYCEQPVWAFAYPFGNPASVGHREYRFAEAAGYECAFVNVGGSIDPSCSRFSLPRVHVTADMSLPVFEAHVSGFHDSLQRKFRRPALDSKQRETMEADAHGQP
jgi:peptidoglycan/xylan/chitin deacetylase (PgdA/CDA1 family)